MGSLQELSIRLSTLAVFKELQEDAVINSLRKYLAEPSPALYASFVSALYRANGGILGAYVREICENSENVYVQAVGKKEEIPAYLREAVLEELKTLQMTAELTPETLRSAMEYRGFLPGFVSEAPDIKACYTERTENIGKYGYGIYAKNRMFYLGENAEIVPVSNPDKTELSDLVDYARERQIIIDNTKALLEGKPAANILLTGDAGTGKSSTVKAVVNALWREGLRIIEVRKDQLQSIPKILDELSANHAAGFLFCQTRHKTVAKQTQRTAFFIEIGYFCHFAAHHSGGIERRQPLFVDRRVFHKQQTNLRIFAQRVDLQPRHCAVEEQLLAVTHHVQCHRIRRAVRRNKGKCAVSAAVNDRKRILAGNRAVGTAHFGHVRFCHIHQLKQLLVLCWLQYSIA